MQNPILLLDWNTSVNTQDIIETVKNLNHPFVVWESTQQNELRRLSNLSYTRVSLGK
jgi:hypothetical protein